MGKCHYNFWATPFPRGRRNSRSATLPPRMMSESTSHETSAMATCAYQIHVKLNIHCDVHIHVYVADDIRWTCWKSSITMSHKTCKPTFARDMILAESIGYHNATEEMPSLQSPNYCTNTYIRKFRCLYEECLRVIPLPKHLVPLCLWPL